MCATPDVVMREYGKTLEAQKNLATEKEIKSAFFAAGYGPKKVMKWWDQYRHINFIVPVLQGGFAVCNDHGDPLFTSVFWPSPLLGVVE